MGETRGINCCLAVADHNHNNQHVVTNYNKTRNNMCVFFLKIVKDWNMKIKIILISLISILLIIVGLNLPTKSSNPKYDYLRLHIRANSNSAVDQNIKYTIKAKMVEVLTPKLCNVPSKEKAIEIVSSEKAKLTNIINQILVDSGFNYTTNIKISNEYFPTRTYENTTLESGYYDAVIVELGSAEGDNWWCVMYPPLCFVNKFENTDQIKFKSRIKEWFSKLFG